MSDIFLMGIAGKHLSPDQYDIIHRCRIIVTSSRHLPLVADSGITILPITPITAMLEKLTKELYLGNVGVLASGDPLFFGIGRTMLQHFNADRVHILPAISSMQMACAILKEPWDDIHFLSLHGRDHQYLAAKLLHHRKTLLFTDHRNSPKRIAAQLFDELHALGDQQSIREMRIAVIENAGLDSERITRGTLAEISRQQFGELNIMFIRKIKPATRVRFGLTETELDHSRGLITKDEIRAATLHQLRLPEHGVFWDVGSGSGSVAVSAGLLNPDLNLFAVERRTEEIKNIKNNIIRHQAYNVRVIKGSAPEALQSLPAPDRVFIGGSGGALADILAHAGNKLTSGGCLVINSVRPETAQQAPKILHKMGMEVTMRTIAVSRWTYGDTSRKDLHPITIITANK